MTQETQIGEREIGHVRVFHMNEDGQGDGPMFAFQRAIGVTQLDSAQIQRVEIADLGDMTLSDFLIAAYDPDPALFAAFEKDLNALEGVVYVVRSTAFIDRPVTLKTDGSARLVATFGEQRSPISFDPLPDGGTLGPVEDAPQKKTPSDAAMGGRVATVALLVMALLVWVMIKIAG